MDKTRWIIFSTIVVFLLGGIIVWSRMNTPQMNIDGIENNSIIKASESNGNIADHTTGSTDNKVLFIEYGDYQCPSCGGAYPHLKTLMDKYDKDVTFVFRNFPLTSMHPNAKFAASAAEAAGLQGKYWEMHDKTQYAKDLGLDTDKFLGDISSKEVSHKIQFDLAFGKSIGVDATPTFYINDKKLTDEEASGIVQGTLDPVEAALDQAIKDARKDSTKK